MKTQKNESIAYSKMLGDLDHIIKKIADNELDLDDMVEQVEQGYDLIKNMKSRLGEAKGKIEQIRESFEEKVEEDSP